MSLVEKLQHTVAEYSFLQDPHDRLSAVIEQAGRQPPLDPGERTDANRVQGCVSVVWLVADYRDGRCHFRSDATSPLVRGLVGFVSRFFSDAPPAEIVTCELDPLAALELDRNLSPTRRHGLTAVRAAIIAAARRWA